MSNGHDSWDTLLPTVQVGGALPVTFTLDGDHVVVEMIVPYAALDPQPSIDQARVPLAIAEGFRVPLTTRYLLPAYTDNAVHFLHQIVCKLYEHELGEQFRVNGQRPFAPDH